MPAAHRLLSWDSLVSLQKTTIRVNGKWMTDVLFERNRLLDGAHFIIILATFVGAQFRVSSTLFTDGSTWAPWPHSLAVFPVFVEGIVRFV